MSSPEHFTSAESLLATLALTAGAVGILLRLFPDRKTQKGSGETPVSREGKGD
ncbi:MAG: hypothetical protein V4437_00700 [Patescibacteria group bacterium]